MSFTIPPAVQIERIAALRKLWWTRFPLDAPDDSVFRAWLSSNSYLTVAYGLSQASRKFCMLQGNMTVPEAVRYASAVMSHRTKVLKNLKQKEKETLCQQSTTTQNSAGLNVKRFLDLNPTA